jgi:hypothetical protein
MDTRNSAKMALTSFLANSLKASGWLRTLDTQVKKGTGYTLEELGLDGRLEQMRLDEVNDPAAIEAFIDDIQALSRCRQESG